MPAMKGVDEWSLWAGEEIAEEISIFFWGLAVNSSQYDDSGMCALHRPPLHPR